MIAHDKATDSLGLTADPLAGPILVRHSHEYQCRVAGYHHLHLPAALVVILALLLSLAWPADLENGRPELLFSTPQSRPRVLLERFGANALVVLLAPVLTWLAVTARV